MELLYRGQQVRMEAQVFSIPELGRRQLKGGKVYVKIKEVFFCRRMCSF